MPNLTFAISDDLYEKIKSHPEIKWSRIARDALIQYYVKLERLDALFLNSELTQEDVERIGREMKKGIHRRHRSRG